MMQENYTVILPQEKLPNILLELTDNEYCYSCSGRAFILEVNRKKIRVCNCGIGIKTVEGKQSV